MEIIVELFIYILDIFQFLLEGLLRKYHIKNELIFFDLLHTKNLQYL